MGYADGGGMNAQREEVEMTGEEPAKKSCCSLPKKNQRSGVRFEKINMIAALGASRHAHDCPFLFVRRHSY